eukprot:IDg15625t1
MMKATFAHCCRCCTRDVWANSADGHCCACAARNLPAVAPVGDSLYGQPAAICSVLRALQPRSRRPGTTVCAPCLVASQIDKNSCSNAAMEIAPDGWCLAALKTAVIFSKRT